MRKQNLAQKMAMTQEFEASYANDRWDLVLLPTRKIVIECKQVYKIKHKVDEVWKGSNLGW